MTNDRLSARAAICIRRPPSEVFSAFENAGAMSKFWFARRDEGLKAGMTSTWYLESANDRRAWRRIERSG